MKQFDFGENRTKIRNFTLIPKPVNDISPRLVVIIDIRCVLYVVPIETEEQDDDINVTLAHV